MPSIQLDINLQKQSDGLSAYQKLHGFLLYRPAYLAIQFEEKEHNKYIATEDEWCKQMIIRMTKAIGEQFCREETAKMSHIDGKVSKSYQPKIGDLVLVHFPDGGSKLLPNWKGVYKIKEKLDNNTFSVALEGNERKKFIVHRLRIRSLHALKQDSEIKVSGENQNLENEKKATALELPSFPPQLPEARPKEAKTISKNGQEMRKSKRKAAQVAIEKMKKMK